MSNFKKRINEYRGGADWRGNFQHLNVTNVEASLRSILTTKEKKKVYNRLGNPTSSIGRELPISLDEKIFRIMVLLDTQMEELEQRVGL